MRWKELLLGLALASTVAAGCKQQCYLTECDYNHYTQDLNLPPNLDSNPNAALVPAGLDARPPTTVELPERPIRYMTLNEAIAIALEQGSVGSFALNGQGDDSLPSFAGTTVALGTNPIRVLALEPAVAGTNIEASLAKFDAQWVTSMLWTRNDQATGGNFLLNFANGDRATFLSSIVKPLPTGGVAGITFDTTYSLFSFTQPGFINPAYRPTLQFAFEQPLLQGFGVEINQLRATHPGAAPFADGSLLPPFPVGGRVEGILITRLRFDQQRTEFERQVHNLLLNVEVAYWNLYGAYWNLYSQEEGLRAAYETWKLVQRRLEAGRVAVQDITLARQVFELFRGQRITAMGTVLEDERQLRLLLGLPVADGYRIVPIDKPTLAPYQPDWFAALNDALVLRPELVLARQDLKFRQLDLINQKNLLLPDVRFIANYDINGLGSHLDGGTNDPNNAFASIGQNDFHDFNVGLRAAIPLGFRDAHSAVRAAQLRLSQSYLTLREAETRAKSFLAHQYRLLFESYAQIQAQRAQREALEGYLRAQFQAIAVGRITLDVFRVQLADYATALSAEYAAVVQYNNAIAAFEYGKGTIMQHDNVVIAEGMLPQCAQVRAVEHERRRAKAIELRERARPVTLSPGNVEKGILGLPQLPACEAPSLPALYQGTDGVPGTTDQAPTLTPKGGSAEQPALPSRHDREMQLLPAVPAANSMPAGISPEVPVANGRFGVCDPGPQSGKTDPAVLPGISSAATSHMVPASPSDSPAAARLQWPTEE